MNKSVIAGIVVVIIVLAGGGILLANHKSSDDTMNMGTGGTNTTATTDDSSSNAVATNAVTIQNFAFTPANITITKGTTVTWTNKDSTAHTVTETDGQNGPKTSNIAPGGSAVFTFDKAGTYHYDCSIHPDMTGTVTVTD